MVRIRLRRMGKTKQPSYRVVIADSRSPRDGNFIEIIGHYEPVRQPTVLHINTERARYWLENGASPSETVVRLLKQVDVLDSEGQMLPVSPAAEAAETPTSAPAPVAAEARVPEQSEEVGVS